MQRAEDERPERCEEVAEALRDPAEPGRDEGCGTAQDDERQCQREATALGQPERGDPQQGAVARREEETDEADSVGERDGEDQRTLGPHPPGLRRREQGTGGAHDVGQAEHQAAFRHRDAGVGEQGRQPGGHRVELHALQPEVDRHVPGERLPEQ